MHPTRRAILAGAVSIPLISCTFRQESEVNLGDENPIGNPPSIVEKNWSEIFIELESSLIKSVDTTLEQVDQFENELRKIRTHHLEHLKVFSNQQPPAEGIFNSKPGIGVFGELSNLRIRHSRTLNFIKNSLAEITDTLLMSTITQIAACDRQVINQLADLMNQVAKAQEPVEVTSG